MIIKNNKGEILYTSRYPNIVIPEKRSAPKLILKHIRAKPDQVLLVDGLTHKEYTSYQVANAIEKAASGLNKLGVKKGDIVGVILPNLPEYVPIFHGVLLIGGVVCPNNPEYTVEEYAHTLGTLKPKVLFLSASVYDRIKDHIQNICTSVEKIILVPMEQKTEQIDSIIKQQQQAAVAGNNNSKIEILTFGQLINNDGKDYPDVEIDIKKDIAVIPFSSGTSGLYKAVSLSHYNIISNTYQTQVIETSNYKKDDTVIGILPFFHIYGMMLFLMLMLKQGHRVVILPKFDPVKFLELIEKYKVSVAFVVPPVVLMFAKSPLIDKYDLSSLRCLFSGAAPLSDIVENAIRDRFNGKLMIKQGFGLTELSPACFVTPGAMTKTGSAGVLLPNQYAKILDTATGAHLGPHEKGEICIKGPNVMLGYYGNVDATNSTIDSDGFLRTGDIGYVDEDGYYYVIDRSKELIKYKGFQVPPSELEALLLSHPKVLDSCVVGVPCGDLGEYPRGFVVLKPNEHITEKELMDYCHPKISNYKHFRGGIYFLSAVPKSSTGKLLRKNLKNFTPPKL